MDNVINSPSTLANSIHESVESYAKDLHVALPGINKSFNADTQLATVQPAIKRTLEKAGETPLPIITNVPVLFPRAGNFVITFPVNPGDECQLLFNERDIGQWVKKGGLVNPSDYRLHSLSDAVAIIGLSSQPHKIADFNTDGIEIRSMSGDSVISIDSDSNIKLENDGAKLELLAAGGISLSNKITGVDLVNALSTFAQTVANITVSGTPIDNKSAVQNFVTQFNNLGV